MSFSGSLYRIYSDYLKDKYGGKVYKLPVNLPVSCPNRDGNVGVRGCIFCGEEAAGFENLPNALPVTEQVARNMAYIRAKYKAEKFIAYFQNFSNTYLPLAKFKEYVAAACLPDIVEIAISTRPDCINQEYLDFLAGLRQEKGVNVSFELGLQTVNYHTLKKINRGHTLAEFLDGVLSVKRYDFPVCVHLILNLPWDDRTDVIENAKVLSALGVDFVKLHSLYVVKNTVLSRLVQEGEISLQSLDEYIERVIMFLEHLDPQIVIQRLIGRAPEENTVFVNWNTSWWKIRDMIEAEMIKRGSYQGKLFNYLKGRALQKFL